jgi:hypothetical protein
VKSQYQNNSPPAAMARASRQARTFWHRLPLAHHLDKILSMQ